MWSTPYANMVCRSHSLYDDTTSILQSTGRRAGPPVRDSCPIYNLHCAHVSATTIVTAVPASCPSSRIRRAPHVVGERSSFSASVSLSLSVSAYLSVCLHKLRCGRSNGRCLAHFQSVPNIVLKGGERLLRSWESTAHSGSDKRTSKTLAWASYLSVKDHIDREDWLSSRMRGRGEAFNDTHTHTHTHTHGESEMRFAPFRTASPPPVRRFKASPILLARGTVAAHLPCSSFTGPG